MVVKANIVKNQTISVDLNQKVGGFNAPVQSVNNKTGDVILDANDVGAISKDELQATTNEILAQAKESGEFDGPQGPQGEKGEKGDTGLTGPQGPAGNDANVTAENIDLALGYTPADRIALEELARRLNALADSDDVTLDQISELVAYIKANRELIEGITTDKVNVSDIIDNLTTNASNKPLSAAQGVALKGLINDLENSFDDLSDWTHQVIDEVVDFVSEPDKTEAAFNLINSDTLRWNGDTTGKLIAINAKDPSLSYVRVSSVVPTLAELQNGGSYATTGADGIEYEEPFTSETIVDGDTYINCFDGYVLVAKEDNVQFVDEYTDCTFPMAGIYFINFGADGYTSKLTITDYTGFAKPVLKMESLTPHGHDWYGKAINKGNTIVSTNTTTQGYVKVSDLVPTEEELRKGGMVRYYNVIDGVKSEELTIGNFLESPYDIAVFDNGMTINIGFEFPVVISFDGTMPIGSISFEGITEAGVYFCQNEHTHTHSLTINEYKEFPLDVKKLPLELIPDGIGGGASSWNDLTDKPFGETTVMGDTLTWDGDMTGKPVVSLDMGDDGVMNFCKVSEAIPTIEDLGNGASGTVPGMGTQEISSEMVTVGDGYIFANIFVIISESNTTVNEVGLTFPETGTWLLSQSQDGMTMHISEFKINNYTGFEMVEVKTIDPKYLPNDTSGDGVSATFTIESAAVGNINSATVTCGKDALALASLPLDKLYNVNILWDVGGTITFMAKPVSVITMPDTGVVVCFSCVSSIGAKNYGITHVSSGTTITEIE